MSFQNFGTTDSSTLESSASASSSVSLFFATIFAWINGCGFVTLNALKFYLVGRSYMRRLSFVLVFLAVFSVLLCSSNNIMYFYHYGKLFSGAEENFSFQSTCDRVFAAWSVFDSLTNTFISISFIHLLRTIGSSSEIPLRAGFNTLLRKVSVLLIIECALLLIANFIVSFYREIDPLWSSIYLAEAIRIRIFCMFLDTLTEMLKKKSMKSSIPNHSSYHLQPTRPLRFEGINSFK